MEQAFNQILAFLAASALECEQDSSPYGALRMMEALRQLIEFSEMCGFTRDERLQKAAERIALEKESALVDRTRFLNLVEETAMLLVELL